MAKKRKSYRGTPKQHRGRARAAIDTTRGLLNNARKAIAAKRCGTALHQLRFAERRLGMYLANIEDMPYEKRPREAAARKALDSAWSRFQSKCRR